MGGSEQIEQRWRKKERFETRRSLKDERGERPENKSWRRARSSRRGFREESSIRDGRASRGGAGGQRSDSQRCSLGSVDYTSGECLSRLVPRAGLASLFPPCRSSPRRRQIDTAPFRSSDLRSEIFSNKPLAYYYPAIYFRRT